MNFRMIKQTLGYLLIFEAAFLLVPIITAIVYAETTALIAFIATLVLCAACGVTLVSVLKPKSKQLFARDGFLIASASWLLMGLLALFPSFFRAQYPTTSTRSSR